MTELFNGCICSSSSTNSEDDVSSCERAAVPPGWCVEGAAVLGSVRPDLFRMAGDVLPLAAHTAG